MTATLPKKPQRWLATSVTPASPIDPAKISGWVRSHKHKNRLDGGGDEMKSSPNWTRTSNPSINSRMLCQLSYGGMGFATQSLRWQRMKLYNAPLI